MPSTAFTNSAFVLLYQAMRVIFLNHISCISLPQTSPNPQPYGNKYSPLALGSAL